MRHESDEALTSVAEQDVESEGETVAEESTGKSNPHHSIMEHLVRESLSPLENEMSGEPSVPRDRS